MRHEEWDDDQKSHKATVHSAQRHRQGPQVWAHDGASGSNFNFIKPKKNSIAKLNIFWREDAVTTI